MKRIRVLIIDDHAMVRSGFRALLSLQPDLEVAGEAADGVAAEEVCKRLLPDVVLMDLSMPGRGGIGAIPDVRRACPSAKILVVTMHEDEAYARQALLAGAAGYVLKKSLDQELLAAIRAVQLGRTYITSSLARVMTQPLRSTPAPRLDANGAKLLTSREREVVSLAALGYTNAEIAGRLHISEKTVESHRKNASTKAGLRTRADLVRFALEYHLIGA